MTPPPATNPAPSRRPLLLALGGCALLVVCVVAIGVVGAGGYFLFNRGTPTTAQPAVEYVLDASPRMEAPAEGDAGTRLSVAQGVLAEIVRPANPTTTSGLRVFGTGAQANACQDTSLVVPLAPARQGEIATRLLDVQTGAAADAAVAEAMLAAIRDLAATTGPHTLVVVTGGADSCNPEAGRLIAEEAARAGIQLQTFVVGFQVPADETEAIRSMVTEAGGSTTYLGAGSADELHDILAAIQKFVDDPAAAFPTITLGTPAAVAPGVTPGVTPGTAADPTQSGVDPQPTTQAGATPEPGGYAAQSACDNPYFPLRQGATWTYAYESGTYTWSVTSVTGGLDQAEAILHLDIEGSSIDYHWTCNADGLVSYDFGTVNIGSGLGATSFTVEGADGTWLPAEELLTPGYSWVNNYVMQTTMDLGGQSMSVTTTVNENRTVGAVESVSVDAGTFESLRVDYTSAFQTSTTIGPGNSFDSSGSVWLVYGVGMVRNNSTGAGESSTTTLVSYTVP